MDLSWVWYGVIIIACMFLMLGVMWITDEGLNWLKENLFNKIGANL